MGYSSGNEGGETAAILDLAPDARHVESSSSKTTVKRVVACVGVALAVVGAFMAYQSVTTSRTDRSVHGAHQHHQHQQLQHQPQPLTLASVQVKANWWPTDHPVLASGQVFMLICAKENKCVDDGGGTSSGSTKLYLVDCDPNNVNQKFTYDTSTNSIKGAYKSNLCWNDDGSRNAEMRLKTCDTNNLDTKFVYDWNSRAIRVPTKGANKCVDGGAYFNQADCDPSRVQQQFEIVPSVFW